MSRVQLLRCLAPMGEAMLEITMQRQEGESNASGLDTREDHSLMASALLTYDGLLRGYDSYQTPPSQKLNRHSD